jgi:hypothetical protein
MIESLKVRIQRKIIVIYKIFKINKKYNQKIDKRFFIKIINHLFDGGLGLL